MNNNGTKYIHNLKVRDSLLSSIITQENYNVNQLIKALNTTMNTSTHTPRREILGNSYLLNLNILFLTNFEQCFFVEVLIVSSLHGATNEKQYVLENADDTKWIVSK